jgi:hypothetical protein
MGLETSKTVDNARKTLIISNKYEKLKTLHWLKPCGAITSLGCIRNLTDMVC